MALIGTRNWNPIGESMWGIASKLQQFNHLSWIEMRRLLGAWELLSFNQEKNQYPDVLENFRIPGLAISCGWSPDVFRASFSDFYQPDWVEKSTVPCLGEHELLRACSMCLATGTHLAIHQFEDLVLCPIHREPLTSKCPNCGALMTPFLISNDNNSFDRCRACHTQIVKAVRQTSGDSAAREQFVTKYEGWLESVSRMFSRTHSYQWIQGPTKFRHIAHINKLVKGPDWIESCVVNGPVAKSTTHVYYGERYETPPANALRLPERELIREEYKQAKDAERQMVNQITGRLRCEVRKSDRRLNKLFQFGALGHGISQYCSTNCTPLYGDMIDAFSNAYWFWRRFYDAAFPQRRRLEKRRDKKTLYESKLFAAWYSSIGQLVWFREQSLNNPANSEFIRWLSEVWIQQEMESRFSQFVGVSCRYVGDQYMNTDQLDTYARVVGDDPLWFVEKSGARAKVYCISTIAKLADFQKLQLDGFKGSGLEYCDSYDQFKPLIELLHTTPKNETIWELQWRNTRQRAS